MEKAEGNYVVAETEDTLKRMKTFYERVNSPRYTNIGTQIKQKVDTQFQKNIRELQISK